MKRKWIALLVISTSLFSLTGCDLPFVIQVQPPPTELDPAVIVQTGIAGTMAVQTAIAGTVAAGQASTAPSLTPQPGGGAPPTATTEPPVPPTATYSPTTTLTFTPSKLMLTVSQDTYCRTGPGTEYTLVTTINVGEQAEVIAKDPYNTSWYIRNPDNPTGFCWVWGAHATISGDTTAVPVFTPQATPNRH